MSLLTAAFCALTTRAFSENVLLPRHDFGLPNPNRAAEIAMTGVNALPEDAQHQLFDLYQAYIGVVNKRKEQHWRSNLLSGEIIEHPDTPIQPARQIEDAIKKREAEAKILEDQVKQERLDSKAPAEPEKQYPLSDWLEPQKKGAPKPSDAALALKAKRKEIKKLKRTLSRSKGISLDWSDAVWAELVKVDAAAWTVTDQTRTAAPLHSAAVACSPAEKPVVCIAFDPWRTGEADAYEFGSWDDGSFKGKIPAEFLLHHLPDASADAASEEE
jgi:hypothetical protein